MRDMSRLKARVEFDIPSEFDPALTSTASDSKPVCYVLMITARLGIAIKTDEDPARYIRVGHLCIYEDGWYSGKWGSASEWCEPNLSIRSFPDIQSIMLV
jgi:hypothetical protein